MKVLFQTRERAFSNPGGDTRQLLKTKEHLQNLGVHVTISNCLDQRLESYDIVHVFNITGQCQSSLIQIVNAKRNGKKVVLSPIYWNERELRKQHSKAIISNISSERNLLVSSKYLGICLSNRFGLQRLIDGISFVRDTCLGNRDNMSNLRVGLSEMKIQKLCLEFADVVLPNSEAEANLLIEDFHISKEKIIVIPNGIDPDLGASSKIFEAKYGLKDFVLSVANIQVRKNTLSLIFAMQHIDIPLVLIGSSNYDDIYCRICAKAINRRKNTLYIGSLSSDSPLLFSAYSASKVHALISWYETPGLSSLEAGLAGSNVVVSDRGCTREYFGNNAWYCDPTDIKSIHNSIVQALNSPKSSNLANHILKTFTWDIVAQKTYQVYKDL
jgi:glycosyltransferase involved in cell wall biosynthesis